MEPGFSRSDRDRLTQCLGKFLPHSDRARLALAGGVAIELQLAARGIGGVRASIADLDFVVSGPDVVRESVSDEFLVSHYHVPQPGVGKFLLQLVDPETSLRLDVFPDFAGSVATAEEVTFEPVELKVLSLDRIFAHKVRILSGASRDRPVDPKHDRDARMLAAVLGKNAAPVAPDALVKDVYRTDVDLVCDRCDLSSDPGFPLAEKREIFRVLGYV